MNRSLVVAIGLLLILLAGCDTGRVNDLEKQNADLKSQIEKQHTAQDYELQTRCAKDARAWFNENYASTSRDKDTILLDYRNHYNEKMNTCFIMVSFHFRLGPGGLLGPWGNDVSLWNVYENSRYGDVIENHNGVSDKGPMTSIATCDMLDTECKSMDEFNTFAQKYMND